MFDLQPPRHIPTLPNPDLSAQLGGPLCSLLNGHRRFEPSGPKSGNIRGVIADHFYNSRVISGLSYKTAFSNELWTSIFPL
jgi:hypothetical protein